MCLLGSFWTVWKKFDEIAQTLYINQTFEVLDNVQENPNPVSKTSITINPTKNKTKN